MRLKKEADKGDEKAKIILNSSPLDARGKYYQKAFNYFWTTYKGKYLQNWPTNPNPDLPSPNRGLELFKKIDEYTHKGFNLKGVSLDSLISNWLWATLENYRKPHWRKSDLPLTFSYVTGKPVLLSLFSNYQFVKRLANKLHKEKKLLVGNVYASAYSIYAPLLDRLSSEIHGKEKGGKAYLRRTLSYQKPNANFLHWTIKSELIKHKEVEKYIKDRLFYGFYPGMGIAARKHGSYWKHPELYERDRQLFRRYIPIIRQLSKAGWQPIT
jgi:hypothetical protein